MDDNCQATVKPNESQEYLDLRRAKRKYLFVLSGIILVYGFMGGILDEDSFFSTMLEFLVGLSALVFALMWCYTDADEHSFTISDRLLVFLIFVFLIAFPYYVLKTRKNGPALATLGWTLLFVILLSILFTIGDFLGCIIYEFMSPL